MNTTTQEFSTDTRETMKKRSREANGIASQEGAAKTVLATIADLSGSDRPIGERLHKVVAGNAPSLSPRVRSRMPADAETEAEGTIECVTQQAEKFTSRCATLGFSDRAKLDDEGFRPSFFAIHTVTTPSEKEIISLIMRDSGLSAE